MSEVIVATIIGGVIASVIPVITQLVEYQKWKRSMRIEHLKDKRGKLERLFSDSRKVLITNMENRSYDVDLVANMVNIFPVNVLEAVKKFSSDKKRDIESARSHYLNICSEMEKSLKFIDQEIEKAMS